MGAGNANAKHHNSLKKKVIRLGDFLHLGHNLLRVYSKYAMHEYSLTQDLLDLVLEQAGSRRIVRVNIWIGPFSEEREDSIHFFWKDLAKGSPGDGATLHFEHIPSSMKRLDCSGAFLYDGEENGCLCEFCHSDHLDLLNGQEIQLESVEFE